MERLATGSRINSASDDAAGRAVASKLTSQIRGIDQAVRNGNDAISLISTADGAMIEVGNMLNVCVSCLFKAATEHCPALILTALNTEFVALRTRDRTYCGQHPSGMEQIYWMAQQAPMA